MGEDCNVEALRGPKACAPRADEIIRDLAARQHGVVARRQLLDAGLSIKAVRVRAERGQLLRLHRGVYAVGHRQLRREGHWLAAVLAIGPGAVLSHRDAAGLHGIRPANHATTEVTSPARGRKAAGIVVHHATLLPDDVTTIHAIPVTTLARTLVDLASVVPADHLAKALREADQQQRLDVQAIERALQRTRGRRGPGHRAMRAALAELEAIATSLTRSSLEAAFLKLTDEAGLPRPRTNADIESLNVDALWQDHRLVVELDGWQTHHTRHAFQQDRTRDVTLLRAGYRVARFTHADVVHKPAWVMQVMREQLSAPSPPRATMSEPCR